MRQRKYVRLMRRGDGIEKEESEGGVDSGVLTTRGLDERIRILQTEHDGPDVLPWRFGVDVPRAILFGVHAGIGYLL